MTALDDLQDKMVARAVEMLDGVTAETPMAEKVDVFKAVTAFYTAAMKVDAKTPGRKKGEGGGTFADIQRRLAGGAPAARVNGDPQ